MKEGTTGRGVKVGTKSLHGALAMKARHPGETRPRIDRNPGQDEPGYARSAPNSDTHNDTATTW